MQIHSRVGIITNSSTQIYTYVTNVQIVKDFINQILKDIGSDKTADELYNFEIQFDNLDIFMDEYVETLATQEQRDAFNALGYVEAEKFIRQNVPAKDIMKFYENSDWGYNSHLVITTKDGQKRICNFQDIYENEESYD